MGDAVLAIGLGGVEGVVEGGQELFQVGDIFVPGDPGHADPEHHFRIIHLDRGFGEQFVDAHGELAACFFVHLGQDEGELVPSQTGEDIRASGTVYAGIRQALEYLIPGEVTEVVVDLLKTVDVKQDG